MASPDGRPVFIPRVPWHEENPLRQYRPHPSQGKFKEASVPPKHFFQGARTGKVSPGNG